MNDGEETKGSELPSTQAEKLTTLMSLCKGAVYITVNDHLSVYETLGKAIKDYEGAEFSIPEDVKKGMLERDCIIDIHIYPRTPVGFVKILHFDMDAALDEAIEAARSY